MPRLHIVIPVFNERETLRPCLESVLAAPLPEGWQKRLIIIDDCSEDANYQAAKTIVTDFIDAGHDIALHRHEVNHGKGAAVQTGYDLILESGAADDDLVIIQDADVEYDPNDYADLMRPIVADQVDAVIGTRWGEHRPAGSMKRRAHELGNRFLTFLSNRMTGFRVSDMECCYKLYSVARLRMIRPMLTERRFGIEPQIVAALSRTKARVTEVPVSYDPRGFSSGKKIGWRDGVHALRVIARERRDPNKAQVMSPRRFIVQLLGFVVGMALLVWCIYGAARQGDWSAVANADPLLVLGLIGCTFVSLAANGAIFWLVIQPIKRLRLLDMELLNIAVAVLNYAPIRAGLIARVAYNVKVDKLPLLVIGAWLAAIAYTMLLTLTAVIVATLLQQTYQWSWWAWAGAVAAQLLIGGLLTIGLINIAQSILPEDLLMRFGKGMHNMLRKPVTLWGAMLIRCIDVAAYIGRMMCAAAILGLDTKLNTSQVTLLAITAMVMSLIPLGRVGYREAGVALVAPFLVGMADIDTALKQLALVESAGEAIVSIPAGLAALFWFRKRWKSAGRTGE